MNQRLPGAGPPGPGRGHGSDGCLNAVDAAAHEAVLRRRRSRGDGPAGLGLWPLGAWSGASRMEVSGERPAG